ncbi:hypothetical protein FRB93_000956 [Tulasnella sp. JGI-2019a]|nr:hypothetical protein FRB93_000956 [Tulasnella sp. JGI-2019a]
MSVDGGAETVTCVIAIQPYTESSLKVELKRAVGGFLKNFTQLLSKIFSESTQSSRQADRNIAIAEGAVNELDLRLRELISSHRRRRNQEVTINHLPVEVLTRVFFHSLHGWHATQFSQLHDLAQVSVRWSQVVKGTPELFSFITTDSTEEQARCALRLSRDAPLDIHYRWRRYDSWRVALLDTLLFQAHRWRSIEMVNVPLEVVNRAFRRATPLLYEIHFADMVNDEGISLNPETLGRLYHLTLERVALRWDPGDLGGLRSLELYSISVGGRPSLPQLLRILRASQEIQVLRLGVGSVADTPLLKDYTPIELSQLNTLSLTDLSHDTAHDLLKSIRIPRCKIFIVKDSFTTPASVPATAVLCNSASHIALTLRSVLQTIGSISISLSSAIMSVHGKGDGLELEFDLPTIPFSGSIHWFEPMLNLVPDSATVSLKTTCIPESGEHFPTLHHPSISAVHIIDSQMEAYRWILHLSTPSATGEWFLPRLKDLKFHNCSIDPSDIIAMAWCRYENGMGYEEEQKSSDKVGKIGGGNGKAKEYDDQRSQVPTPLRLLKITGFNRLFASDFAELEGIVGSGNVIWDNDGP